jgi:hypothetical protein
MMRGIIPPPPHTNLLRDTWLIPGPTLSLLILSTDNIWGGCEWLYKIEFSQFCGTYDEEILILQYFVPSIRYQWCSRPPILHNK